MNLQEIVDERLMDGLRLLAEEDELIKKIVRSSRDPNQFINSLIAGIICISEREKKYREEVVKCLESNPQIKEALKARNESNNQIPA